MQNTVDFLSSKDYTQSMLIVPSRDSNGLSIAWDRHLQQVLPLGLRVVRLSSADVTQLADVAHTLQQYPRVKFAVICSSLMCGEGSSAHAALQSVLAGTCFCVRQCLACCRITSLLSAVVSTCILQLCSRSIPARAHCCCAPQFYTAMTACTDAVGVF